MFPTYSDWDIKHTRKGLLKLGARRILNLLLIFGAISGIMSLRRGELKVVDTMRNIVRQALAKGANVLHQTSKLA